MTFFNNALCLLIAITQEVLCKIVHASLWNDMTLLKKSRLRIAAEFIVLFSVERYQVS